MRSVDENNTLEKGKNTKIFFLIEMSPHKNSTPSFGLPLPRFQLVKIGHHPPSLAKFIIY
jgi:hypothetical protein